VEKYTEFSVTGANDFTSQEMFVHSKDLVQGYTRSRDSSVGIALVYGLEDLMIGVRFPAGTGNFSLHHRV
jgi:hypothetical protein